MYISQFAEVLDEYLATLNVGWSNEAGMALNVSVFFQLIFLTTESINIFLIVNGDEVEFRWVGNKLFLPGDANQAVGDIYNTYLTGEMAHYYAVPGASTAKKAASARPQFSMALELYIDKPKVSSLLIVIVLIISFDILSSLCFDATAPSTSLRHLQL